MAYRESLMQILSLIMTFATRFRRFGAEWRAAAGCVAAALLTACPSEEATVSRQPIDGAAVEAALEGSVPLARAGFDVYLWDDASLIYVKESCTGSDWAHKFYLRVYSGGFFRKIIFALSDWARSERVDEFRFWDADYARILDDGRCVAAQRIPDIGWGSIKTGQVSPRGVIWDVGIEFPEKTAYIARSWEDWNGVRVEPSVRSYLYAFDVRSVLLPAPVTNGGAIEPLGNDLLVATPRGALLVVGEDGAVERLRGHIPMNSAGFERLDVSNPDPEGEVWTHGKWPFRVADILVKRVGADRWELFATHHYFAENCIRFRLSSATLKRTAGGGGDRFTVSPSWKTLFDAEPCLNFPHGGHQSGGRMVTDGPDRLLVVIGDHQRDGWGSEAEGRSPALPQDPDSHFGKLISVDIATGRAEVLAFGLRNPQGLARDRDGRLWASEHGTNAGDELNVLKEGRNYGWPHASYALTYQNTVPKGIDLAQAGSHEGFELPAYSWMPAIAVSPIAVNDETRLPLWKDDLLVGSFREKLFRVRREGSRVIYVEAMMLGEHVRIRDIATMPDGRIALLIDQFSVVFLTIFRKGCGGDSDSSRRIHMLPCGDASVEASEPAPLPTNASAPPARLDSDTDDRGAVSDGAELFASHCGQCHRARLRQHDVGPHLVGVIGRRAGDVAGYDFSAAFEPLDVVWTRESLAKFLVAPDEFVRGDRMPATGVSQAQAQKIVEYIGDG